MILADKIINERKRNGWSQEELAEKLSVSRQSVSKWESAQSVPDLQRIIQMANLFGVSTDYLLREDMEDIPVSEELAEYVGSEATITITMEEANEFIEIRRETSTRLSGGVACCTLSPIVMLVLLAFPKVGSGAIPTKVALGIGLTVLMIMVAMAVYIFVMVGIRRSKYEFLEKEGFETAYGVTGKVKEMKKDYEGRYTYGMAIGVILCILSAIPVILSSLLDDAQNMVLISVAILLTFAAAGAYLIVNVSDIQSGYNILLQEGEYNILRKKRAKFFEKIAGVYWSSCCAIYLAYSFITMDWGRSWIIWPVAGVLYGVVGSLAED